MLLAESPWMRGVHPRGPRFLKSSAAVAAVEETTPHWKVPAAATGASLWVQVAGLPLPEAPLRSHPPGAPGPSLEGWGRRPADPRAASGAHDCQGEAEASLGRAGMPCHGAPGVFLAPGSRVVCE